MDLYQHAKKEAVLSICSEVVNLKILQSDWLRVFWPNFQKNIFPEHGSCLGTHIITCTFITEQILGKLLKNYPIFWPISPIFYAKKVFQKYPALLCALS